MSRMSFVQRALVSAGQSLLALVIVVAVIAGAAALALNHRPSIAKGSWLVIDLHGEVTEWAPPGDVVGTVTGGGGLVLQDMLDALHKAAHDKRIAGVIWRLSSGHDAGLAKLDELRAAIRLVRDAGKPVYAWGDSFDLPTLFLAAACDSVLMPAGGYCELRGLAAESMHVRGTLTKLGVVPHISKLREYKAAAEMVTETQMTPAARENRTWMLAEEWAGVVPALARDRRLDEGTVGALMEAAFFTPAEARQAGLIDSVLYWPDLEARLAGRDDEPLPVVALADYAHVSWRQVGLGGKDRIAVVHAQGMIGGRENRVDPLLGIMMGHETTVAALRRARLDEDVKAVVLRVDSPGGEGLASDLIAHEVDLTARRKPVVVSMVDVAASGGYMIAYKATKLMADPLTITGSIGSISGFFDARGLYDKLGITKDVVAFGPNATLGSDYREPTPEEWQLYVANHERGFEDWLKQVAARRNLSWERAQQLSGGRVFSGRQAQANGLVDALGTLDDAVALAAQLTGIAPDRRPRLVHLPERRSLLATLFAGEGEQGPVAAALRWQAYRLLRQQVRESAANLRAVLGCAPY